jgi:predicted alpha/beta hydrolase family esterase
MLYNSEAWKLTPINLGPVGHINVASGFGPFPDILNYLLPEKRAYLPL